MRQFVLASILFMAAGAARASETCSTLEDCFAQYPIVASNERGVSKKAQELATTVQAYGAKAIPNLLKLLEHQESGVRRLAGYTLRDMPGLLPEHLEPLIRATEAGDGWIPPAIARIGTPRAIEFLAKNLEENPQTETQVTYAFKILGSKGAPAIAELLACEQDCDTRVFASASFVFREIGEVAIGVVPRLLEIAQDERFTISGRRSAIESIGYIDVSQGDVPALLELRSQDKKLVGAVNTALLKMGSTEAVTPLLEALTVDPERVMRDLIELGSIGYDAGLEVQKYLTDRVWDTRVAAAITLGRIGYTPASPALAEVLADNNDWKLAYAASISLARLSARDSTQQLENLKRDHWYPPVREMAGLAITSIQSGEPLDVDDWWRYGTVGSSPEACEVVSAETEREDKATKLYTVDARSKLEKLSYDTVVLSYGAPEGTEPNEHGIIEVTNENMVENIEHVQQVPDIASRISHGWLVGSDRGEWGGELVYIPDRGEHTVLYDGNVEDIYHFGKFSVATTGLAHLGMNNGFLLRISKADTDGYVATQWRRLPAAPNSSWLLSGGRLLVNTHAGSVIVEKNGDLNMAECSLP